MRPIASHANPADAVADALSPVLTVGGAARVYERGRWRGRTKGYERGRKSSLALTRVGDEDGGRMRERVSRGSRPVARQEPFPIDVIDMLFYPFFHFAPRPAVRLRITTRRDRSRAMCCNALGIDGGRLPATGRWIDFVGRVATRPEYTEYPVCRERTILTNSPMNCWSRFLLSENIE